MDKLFQVALILLMLSPIHAHAQKGPQGPVPVIVSPVAKSPFADRVEALGTTKANETVVITADTTEKVAEIHFEDGQEVSKGDLLVTLDKNEEEAQLRAADAVRTEARLAYERAKNLQQTSALSQATVQERLATVKQGEAAFEAIQARLNELTIKAPFDGVMGLRQVSVGGLVQPGDVVTTIDDLSRIKVDFDIPSAFLATLKSGQSVIGRVDAFDREFEGEVRTVDTQVDPVTRTITVRAELPNPDHLLKPGLLMTITLLRNEREALLIPEEALIKRGDKNFVYVARQEEAKMIAREQEVVLGARQPGIVEVKSGLEEGDLVVSHGVIKIKDGAEITIRATETGDTPLDQLLEQPAEGKAS